MCLIRLWQIFRSSRCYETHRSLTGLNVNHLPIFYLLYFYAECIRTFSKTKWDATPVSEVSRVLKEKELSEVVKKIELAATTRAYINSSDCKLISVLVQYNGIINRWLAVSWPDTNSRTKTTLTRFRSDWTNSGEKEWKEPNGK